MRGPELFNVQAQDCLQIPDTFSWPLIFANEERQMLDSRDSATQWMLQYPSKSVVVLEN